MQKEIEVGADGKFTASIIRDQRGELEGIITETSINREALKKMSPQYASNIDGASDDELREGMKEMLDEFKEHPHLNYVLVSYDKSGNREAEAASMQFIGLPNPGASLKMLPGGALKGDLNLGGIKGEGDEATSELTAGDSVNLPPSVLAELASASKTLKILKNDWLNPSKAARVTPWFGYVMTDLASSANKFSAPEKATYNGGGYYIGVNNIDATFGEICPANPSNPGDSSNTPYAATPAKVVSWFPPRDTQSVQNSGQTFGPTRPYTNAAPRYKREEQYGEIACGSDGGQNGLYTRASGNGNKEYQLQLGEYFIGASPEGLWRLKVGSDEKGRWDLAAAAPYDKDGDPIIYIPSIKIVTDNNKATGFEVKFYFFEKGTKTFREVTDAVGLKSLVHSFNMDGSYGITRNGGDLSIESKTIKFDGSVLKATIPVADQAVYPCSNPVGATQCHKSFGFNFHVGAISYRLSISAEGNP